MYKDKYDDPGSDISEVDVNNWINLNKIEIYFTQTHLNNFWPPLTIKVEDLECTVERIFHITSKPIQNTGCEKLWITVDSFYHQTTMRKTVKRGYNNHEPKH